MTFKHNLENFGSKMYDIIWEKSLIAVTNTNYTYINRSDIWLKHYFENYKAKHNMHQKVLESENMFLCVTFPFSYTWTLLYMRDSTGFIWYWREGSLVYFSLNHCQIWRNRLNYYQRWKNSLNYYQRWRNSLNYYQRWRNCLNYYQR